MKGKKLIISGLCAILCNTGIAGVMGSFPSWSPVMTLSLGPGWSNNGDAQTFFLTPQIEKTYTADNHTSSLFNGELFYGWQHPINSKFQGQVGIAIAGSSDARFSGEIWDDADPEFNNYRYSYKINHAYVALKGKLLADLGSVVLPYISGSLGVGFNNAHHFIDVPVIFEALPNPYFGHNIQTTFSYTIGAGIQKAVSRSVQLGLGYELADWGKSELGRTYEQTLGTGLSQSHIYTNALVFSINYLG